MTAFAQMRGRVLRAVGADMLGQVLNIGVRLVLVPLYLSAWGAEAYGEWLIMTAVAGWFSLGDLGGQLYFVNRLTAEWAEGNHDIFQRVLTTGVAVFVISSTTLLLCVVLVLSATPALDWLQLHAVETSVAMAILFLMASRFLIALPLGLYLGIYRATGAQATSVMFANLVLLIQFVASVLALLVGAGMLVLAAIEVLPMLVVAIIVGIDLRKRLPANIRLFDLSIVDRSILRASISPSLHFLGIQLAMAFMIQGSVIAVAKALGPVEVAIFSSMRTVSNVVHRILGMLSHAIWPEVTRLERTGQRDKLTFIFKLTLMLTLLVGMAYLMLLQSFGNDLYDWWLNRQLRYEKAPMILMGCFVLMTALWTVGGNLLMATNCHEAFSRFQLPVNIVALLLCYAGAANYGLAGAVSGLLIGQSILMLGVVILILNRIGWQRNSSYLLKVSVWGFVLLPACLNFWSGVVVLIIIGSLTYKQLRLADAPGVF